MRGHNPSSTFDIVAFSKFILVGLALDVQLMQHAIPMDASDWLLDALVVGDGSVLRG